MAAGREHRGSRAVPGRGSARPPPDYCSTSPGGTRIIYDREFLLDHRNSPVAQSPPARLPLIPGVTSPNLISENGKNEANCVNNHNGNFTAGADAQFEMDI